jgi:hypothetical protein
VRRLVVDLSDLEFVQRHVACGRLSRLGNSQLGTGAEHLPVPRHVGG